MKQMYAFFVGTLRAGALACGVLTVLSATASPGRADLVTNISTGVDALGNPLGDGAVDPKWTVAVTVGTLTPGLATNATKVLDPGHPNWVANTNQSKWITPNDIRFTNDNAPPPAGSNLTFTYTTTFTLDAFQAANAYLAGGPGAGLGFWTSDNNGVQVLFNNANVATTLNPSVDQPFLNFYSFGPLSGFVAGTNTLQFIVRNIGQTGGNPTGLRVEGTINAVPEPSTLAAAAMGAGVLGFFNFRRKAKAARHASA